MILTGILMGLAGTLAMDIWAWALSLFGQTRPNWAMPGRWLGHVLRGRVFHDDIGAAEPVPGELGLGWALHYGVGVFYGVVFVALAGPGWVEAPTFLPLWAFSLVTIAAGWFLLPAGDGAGLGGVPDAFALEGAGDGAGGAYGVCGGVVGWGVVMGVLE